MAGSYSRREGTDYWQELEGKEKAMIKEILLLRSEGNSAARIGMWLGLSERQIFRYIAKAKQLREMAGGSNR